MSEVARAIEGCFTPNTDGVKHPHNITDVALVLAQRTQDGMAGIEWSLDRIADALERIANRMEGKDA